jgi:catechol 2,3-dioxygenase-like lactoylglutathione lyase family enzyme
VFDHVTIRASDRPASERFYDIVLAAIGLEQTYTGADFAEWGEFSLAQATDGKPTTQRLHIAFFAESHDAVDAFWRAGVDAGYRSDGEPGLRPQYRDDYYGAFLLDCDGNSAEAVHHGAPRTPGKIDHLWIRVADVEASTRFYELVAPDAGFRLRHDAPDRAQFVGADGSFSLVAGPPTENLHLAFAADTATVDRFHRTLVDAGYADDGAPGERPEYHAGYYGAFVLDPDGNSVELVDHNR